MSFLLVGLLIGLSVGVLTGAFIGSAWVIWHINPATQKRLYKEGWVVPGPAAFAEAERRKAQRVNS